MITRLHAVFSGRVQGVGFRFTAERMACRFPVTGYVRNLAKGKVEMTAEGEKSVLEDFLAALREAFGENIRDVEVEWSQPSGEFKGFGIRF